MSAHTPGPWTIQDNREMCDGELWIMATHPDVAEVSIAAVRSGCEEADEIGDNAANARMIAAAPDLLAALQKCAAKFREYEAIHAAKPAPEKAAQNAAMAAICEAVVKKATS